VLLLLTLQVWLSTATEVFYVLPDNSTNISCPSQPCATLSQGTLPVVSNVEYHFLPGEHHLYTTMRLKHLSNVLFVGVESKASSSSPVILISCSNNPYFQILIKRSQNVTISEIMFRHCKVVTNVTYLLLNICTSCKLENIYFKEGGIITHNVFANFIINNVNIEFKVLAANSYINYAIQMIYDYEFWDSAYQINTVEISNSFITGMSGIMISDLLDQMKYDVNVTISNSVFYRMKSRVIRIKSMISSQFRLKIAHSF